ncbi:hypothetical protein GH714_012457 [Hevea brasiliensis]|uniref:Uncharacterized protein n=1 Tax=Hevea brasiliensis TaxID=3981 RepID=A0A6A6KQL8_HEVBR|nr:hypothetical protein GH714_012457 [Hevea brasiliensis]
MQNLSSSGGAWAGRLGFVRNEKDTNYPESISIHCFPILAFSRHDRQYFNRRLQKLHLPSFFAYRLSLGLHFLQDGTSFSPSSSDRTVHVWDCDTDQSIIVINLGDKIWALISEGPWIFVSLPNSVKAWNIETATEVNLDGPIGQVYAMAVAYVVDMLFAGAQDGAILAWKESTENPKPFELVSSLKGHTTAVICLTIGKNRLCSGSMDNTIRVWDLNTLQCIHTLSGHNDVVTSLICWDQPLLTCSLQDNKSISRLDFLNISCCGMIDQVYLIPYGWSYGM